MSPIFKGVNLIQEISNLYTKEMYDPSERLSDNYLHITILL